MDTIEEVTEVLRQRLRVVRAEAKRLEAALSALAPDPIPGDKSSEGHRPSVRALVVSLLAEEDRDWSVGEILAEYERRGAPVHGQDPSNAARAALADAKKRGMVTSTTVGRYRSATWPSFDPNDPFEDFPTPNGVAVSNP